MTMTSASLSARTHDGGVPDGDPAARPARRRFSAQYKLATVEEYERLTDSGAEGALLRREGLYSSHIVEWRRARDTGAISGLAAKHRKQRSDTERELEKARNDRPPRRPPRPAPQGSPSPRDKHRSSWRGCWPRARRRDEAAAVIDECFALVEPLLGTAMAAVATGRSRATVSRRRRGPRVTERRPRPAAPNKLSDAEVAQILRSPRFVDAPRPRCPSPSR